MVKSSMTTSEIKILEEIQSTIRNGQSYSSRQQGKNFYHSVNLYELLSAYVDASKRPRAQTAKTLDITPATLQRIIDGHPISENMLFRIRNAMERSLLQTPGIELPGEGVFPGDWRSTGTKGAQEAIAVVSEQLIGLKDAIRSSNSLGQRNAPIDEIQVAQLVALLEATLAAIKAPYVETKQTRGFFRWVGEVGRKAVEKGLEGKIVEVFGKVIDAGSKLIDVLTSSSGPPDLGGMVT
jgi:hypothetical protein